MSSPTPADPLFDSSSVGIALHHLTKRFPGSAAPAVSDLSLEIEPGSMVCLVGPSGCGKTTILRMINRLLEPTSGSIEIGGVDIRTLPAHELRRRIGYVIQHTGLFPHRTIESNIGTVPKLVGWNNKTIRDRVVELAELVGLDRALLSRYPSELSGGQQQRVGVARALAADPPLLLMDEPYSAVDPIVRDHLQNELLELQSRLGKTIVVVTHDIDEAIKLGDRIAILRVGGELAQFGSPEAVLTHPADEFVAAFLGDDRGLKRLALTTVGAVDVRPGPVVDPSATVEHARQVAAAERTDWVAITDGDGLAGWIPLSDLDDSLPITAHTTRAFAAAVDLSMPLRAALDRMLDSVTSVAVVSDRGRHVGLLTMDDLGETLRRNSM